MSPSPSVSPFPHAGRHLLAWRRAAAPARPPPAATRPNYGLITPRPAPFQTLPSTNLICPPPAPSLSLPFPIPERAGSGVHVSSSPVAPSDPPFKLRPVVLCWYKKTTTTALQLPPLSQLQSTPRPAGRRAPWEGSSFPRILVCPAWCGSSRGENLWIWRHGIGGRGAVPAPAARQHHRLGCGAMAEGLGMASFGERRGRWN